MANYGYEFSSVVTALCSHAANAPNDPAYIFLDERGQEAESLTFAELDRAAKLLADDLRSRLRSGDRVLLVFPPGLAFVVAFFACQYAGAIAVPSVLPRHRGLRDSSLKIADDCAPSLGLTSCSALPPVRRAYGMAPRGTTLDWLGIDIRSCADSAVSTTVPVPPSPDSISYLQYTSGSTSAPKGVIVSHRNLCANLHMIGKADALGSQSTRVGWIPLHHDMGLIFNCLQATWVGALCVLVAPLTFMADAFSWLRAIHKYRAEVAIAPNFAYDLCVEQYHSKKMRDVDLSCWKLALNGAEPVRATTLERFVATFSAHGLKASAPHPTYGMAEATLMISGGLHGGTPKLWRVSCDALQRNRAIAAAEDEKSQVLVGCGKSLTLERIAIVDPIRKRHLPSAEIGEIWVHGPNVAQGYWHNAEATLQTFQARIEGDGDRTWLRTGDFGCFDDTGELYITGRMKDMIIIRGANYYPQDIELTAEMSHPALRPGHSAAFTFPQGEQEFLAVACEVRREHLQSMDVDEVIGAVRSKVIREHDLTLHRVILTPPGTVPKTTSGKIRRRATRDLWQKNELPTCEFFLGTQA
jgi:acyl-CoA synthetase (AMP-forming)/AMP-acid ligase II